MSTSERAPGRSLTRSRAASRTGSGLEPEVQQCRVLGVGIVLLRLDAGLSSGLIVASIAELGGSLYDHLASSRIEELLGELVEARSGPAGRFRQRLDTAHGVPDVEVAALWPPCRRRHGWLIGMDEKRLSAVPKRRRSRSVDQRGPGSAA